MPQRNFGVVMASVIGAVVGALVTRALTTDEPVASGVVSEAPAARESARTERNDARLDRLAARVRELEAAQQGAAVAAADAVEGAAADSPLREAEALLPSSPSDSPELDTERALDEVYTAEPVDPAWARAASADLGADLAQHARELGTFQVVELECRSSICRSVLRFGNRADADAAGKRLIRARYARPCQRTVLRPAPPAEGAPPASEALSTLYFHCGQAPDSDRP